MKKTPGRPGRHGRKGQKTLEKDGIIKDWATILGKDRREGYEASRNLARLLMESMWALWGKLKRG